MNQKLSMLLCASLFLPSCGKQALAGARPNIVLISLDTLRADHLGAYGYGRETSPNIDALAQRSIVFEHCYSQSPKTAPSHMSIMTGVVPDMHGVMNLEEGAQNLPLSEDIPTMASILRDRGYQTVAITNGGHVVSKIGFDRGFEGNFAVTSHYTKPFKLAEMALERYAERPFFLFVHTYEIHDPYTPPDEYRDMFVDPEYDGPIDSCRSDESGDWANLHREYWQRVRPEAPEDRQHLIDLYDGSIRFVDTLLGELLSKLDELGLTENTIVILLSDHGEEFGEHEGFLHETVYQELLHVPLILSVPQGLLAIENRGRVSQTVRLIDVLPTVLELTDTRLPEHVQGASLVPLFEGVGGDRDVFSTWPRTKKYAYQKRSFKLIQRPMTTGAQPESWELYALDQDAGEQFNRLESPTESDLAVLEELRQELKLIRTTSEKYRGALSQGKQVELDPEERAALKALGYLK